MAVIDLSAISFRANSVNTIDGATGTIGTHGSPTIKIHLSAIKFRANSGG